MAHMCRECKEPVKWGASPCPHCGEENPTGANPGDVWLWSIAVLIIVGLATVFGRQFGAALFDLASH
jgi:hypothetical protein